MLANILFVEDNDDLRENAALVLELEGYQVRVARDGREALDILEEGFTPNLIVSDIMMPRMDGYEFFAAVRERTKLKAVPFIFLTARGSRQEVSMGRMLGADDYLVKPFDPEEFLIAVQNKLQRAAEIGAYVAENLSQARRSLVQLLSHELRTPLTYVTGGFALLAEELEAQPASSHNEDIRVSLELIQSGTQRLNRLAEQMVLYSEIISGVVAYQVRSAAEPVALHELVHDALDLVHDLCREQGPVITRSMSESEPVVVWGVRGLLITAISEVIRNAVQFSPKSGPIKLVVTREEGHGTLIVIDRGHGIQPEDQHRIWDVLYQSGRERTEQQGIGMGLPIAKGIVTAHNGDVLLFSVPGQGTEVTLKLPLAPAD
jgi:two-component system, sensor histidine kinase and response regulator